VEAFVNAKLVRTDILIALHAATSEPEGASGGAKGVETLTASAYDGASRGRRRIGGRHGVRGVDGRNQVALAPRSRGLARFVLTTGTIR
jgi:hypothetical protein